MEVFYNFLKKQKITPLILILDVRVDTSYEAQDGNPTLKKSQCGINSY